LALPPRLRHSCQMEHEVLREIINVANRQARTYLTHVYRSLELVGARRC
jgi:hypothetical protein